MHEAVRKAAAFRDEAEQLLPLFQATGMKELFHDDVNRSTPGVPFTRKVREPLFGGNFKAFV